MKIAIVSDVYFGYISGAAMFAKRITEQLSENIEKVVLLTSGPKRKVEQIGKIKVYFFTGISFKKFEDLSFGLFSLHKIDHILKKEKIDLVHIQLPTMLGMFAALCTVQVETILSEIDS